ncbi:unnamed protein product [Gulo gulo]|uniref:Uncharacterized protein n=1 Tax=Gulo gulo TaxID=48420 RepID=A0A9X9M392_GULGU|nr:unnamed protein product [Gulo gulo]
MCFPLIAGDSPVARGWPDKAVLKYRQSTVSKQSEKERECCSGNSSGMGRDLAAILQLENLTGAASEHGLGLLTLTLGGLSGRLLHRLLGALRDSGRFSSAALGSPGERCLRNSTHTTGAPCPAPRGHRYTRWAFMAGGKDACISSSCS